MTKYQEEYIKLLDEKFEVVGKPKVAYYSYSKTPDIGILVELKSLPVTRVFISYEPKSYYHKFNSELDSKHLPNCIWLTRKPDKNLCLAKGLYI